MTDFLADALLKATVLLLLAAGITGVLRRATAALRHLVWTLACVGLLALPLASAVVPAWPVAAWPELDVPLAFDATPVARQEPAAVTGTQPSVAITPVPADPVAPASQPDRWMLSFDWTVWLVPLWLAGVVLMLAVLAIGHARIAWLGRTATPVRGGDWPALLASLARELGVRRRVRLLHAAGPDMPMTWGIRQPVILLPAEAADWPSERRRDVLLHELAHVRRLDVVTQLLASVARAIYWFHPLAWFAATRMRIERERACDDQVLRGGTKPSTYASHLLEIARALRPAGATSLASVAMARPAQLATRLLEVLDPRRRRDPLSSRAATPALLAAAGVVLPLAALTPRAAEPEGKAVAPTVQVAPQHPVAPPVRLATAVLFADTLRDCAGTRSRGFHHRINRENGTTEITTDVGRCTVKLAAAGKFTLTGDFTDIATVAPGGSLEIEVDYGTRTRRVTVRPAAGGVERVYTENSDVRPYDAAARAWLAETLTFLLRRTGHLGEERARWILERRGVPALLQEIALLDGDYARRIYYQAAVASGRLGQADYERLVEMAGQSIRSDFELAEFLVQVATQRPLTARMQAGFVAAARTIGSDYEQRRVLQAALARDGLDPVVQRAMLEVAADISSDFELAELLIELIAARAIDDAARPALFAAVRTLQSDHEQRRVLDAVLRGGNVSPAMLADALDAAKTINSDFELAELLRDVGTRYVVDEAWREPFFAAVATIRSDHERGRVLAAVLERGPASLPVTLALLDAARGIRSDFELAEFLLKLMRRVPANARAREGVRAAAETIGSQYERGRVFEALARWSARAEL